MAMIHDGDSEALEREEIAIIGMAGRFPGAADVEAFWANLRGGVESTRAFSDAELAAAGVDAAMRARPEFVNSGALADHLDAFDADFFGIGRREAELMDPQHRVLLEVAWEALERAGYDPAATPATIGVFGGVAPNTYRGHVQRVQPTLLQAMGGYIDLITSEREYAITRIAHRLDLRGAAVSVNTACSSSGVALHLACQSLLAGENDLCLVAGARVRVPLTAGYLYTEDGIPSPDGHCRAFDADARGTAIGNGAAAIVLKRLSDARADRDWIHAVVKGTAINNDGAAKVGFTAPGVRGQSAAIAEALAMAEVSADSIGYLEAHGTGTALGDPIEITAATKAFRRTTQRRGFCAVGSVKTNIGHLDAGAGVTGVIKTALALERRELPPSLNFERPNPQIDFASSPFFVNDHLRPWDAGDAPRRAGVSCFGLGGTNAHAVLEEGPARAASAPARRRHQLLVWSARDGAAVERASARLAAHLRDPAGPAADQDLADIAYTLQVGRRHFEQRRALVSGARDEAAAAFGDEPGDALLAPRSAPGDKAVAFLFPGGGAQYVGMGRDLFEHEPVFRAAVEECLGPASVALSVDLLAMLYPTGAASPELVRTSERPSRALPLLFAIEYALAQLWTSWGLRPTAMIGHSMGEYTAACLAGVVTVGDGMRIVLERGRLFEQLAPGAMLSVALPPDDARLVGAPLCAAAINRPGSCVLSGPVAAIEELQRALAADGVDCTRVHISVAAHSAMVEPILNAFGAFMGTIPLRKPEIPYVSNVTGEWIQAHEVTDPQYWVRHLRQTVRFADGLTTLLGRGGCVLLEVGPGQTLSTFARQHPDAGRGHAVVASMRHPRETAADDVFALRALGRAYVEGVAVDWQGFAAAEVRGRVPLPTYPFARERHWIDGVAPLSETPAGPPAPTQAPAAAEPRQRRVRAGLAEAVHELTGQAPAQIDPHASFLELGFDSLLLTQAGSAFRARFGVPVSFRQLFEQTPNLDRLATYIDERLPADALPPPAAPLPIDAEDPGAGPAGVGSVDGVTALERVIRDQMQLMREQLAMLRGDTTTAPPAAAVSMADAPMAAAPWAGTPLTGAAPVDGGGLVSSTTAVVHGPWNPPERGAGAVLTPTQQRHLDALIERFTARTRRSKEWTQQHRARLADPRTAAGFRRQWKELVYPIVADRAQGSKLWDLDGNEWLDISMGFGVTVFGHSPDFVIEAVRERLDLGMAIGPQTTLAGDVAELLCELTGFERAALCNTGSEAVLAAIRAARTVSGRDAIVMFTNSYHGMFDEVVVRGLPAAAGATPRAVPLAPGIPRGAVEQVIVLEYGAPESLDIIAAHADRIAAVLVEPVQSRDPECQPREFVVDLRRLTADRGIALVFDEMVTGFRLHQGGAQAHYGVEADLGTFGKVVGGGMPIGVVAGTARYLDALDGGHWQFGDDSVPEAGVTWFAGTFVRHPLALAAAKAALQRLADQGPELQETLNARTLQMRDEANAWFEAEDLPVRLRGFASHFLILPSAAADGELEYASLYFHYLRDRGIHCHERRPHFLTLAHSDEDLAWLQCALREAALEMRAAGFFPPAGGNAVILPLTEAQQEIWLASRLDDDASRAFHLSAAMDLRGTLDRRALDAAIAALPRCHEALRLRIAADGEHQEVLPGSAAPLPFAEHDLRALARESRGARLAELQRADVEEPFDLETGPLLRLRLMVLGDAHYHLVLTAHHVVCDGWSMGILMRDLGALYAAAEGGGAASLPAPPGLQFSAYARDLQHRLEGPSGAAAKAHWLDSLAGELPVLDLPTDRPRPAFKTYTGGQRGIELDAAALAAIKEYAGERGATPFALLLAAYAVWLKRLCSTDDVVIGVAMAGQPAAGSRDLVGHCVSLYPLRSRASPSEPFGRHAAEMQSALLDSLDHADCTYGSLLAELALPRDPGRLPLLSTLVTYETETQGLGFGDLALQVEAAPKGYCNFDLELYLTETAAGLRVEFHYNADLFESTTIDRWLENYATLLDSLQRAGATAPAATLDMFGARERALLQAWNATAAPFPREIGVHDLVTRQAARTPDAVAVVTPASAEGGDSATLRYAEVETRACRLAQLLLQRGVAVGDRVALCMPRTAELLVAILAIWKAGACYVPLDPDYPRARLAHTLADSSARLVVTDSSVWPGVHDAGVEVCALDREAAALAALEPRDPQLGVGGEALAYVLYTSGSTGKPKGVQVPHRAVSNLLAALTRVPGLDASDCWLAVATVAFDVSVAELWLPLVVGAQVVLASSVDAQDGTRLSHLLDAHGVTVMQATPATWRLLLEGGWAGRDALRIVSAGEALSVELARELTARSREVWNLYGPTETTVYSTGTAVPRAPDRITIGRPIANTRAHVLDAQGIPVPIGAVGELVLAGEGVTLGYLGRDDLTAERFVPDPDATGQRRYRTGDLVRWRADGELEFLGRGDQQVKLRGFRIELGEIESVLVQQPGVRAAAVARREDVPGDQRLVAYVVAEGSSEPAVAALRQGLRDHLPEYMVPATYVVLDALPLTPNRKLDRAALPAPDGEAALSSRHEQVPPRTDTERALAEIWADVLGHAAVGTNENFFDLGGYSLLAARVLSRCRVRFPVAVSLRQLFMAPTVAQLAAVIDAMRSQDATASDDAPDARFEIEL